jgi:hypothetical protein
VEVLGGILAVLLAVTVLLLVMPLRVALRIATDPLDLDLRLAPFAGLLGEFGLPHRARRRVPHPDAPTRARRRSAMSTRHMVRALPAFLSALAGRIRIDRLRLDLRFGTGDPALTGQVYGWLMALAQGVGGAASVPLRVLPEFERACLAGTAEVVLRLTPLRLAGPLFRLWRAGQGRP